MMTIIGLLFLIFLALLFPHVMRFLFVALFLGAITLVGWIMVLSPAHAKSNVGAVSCASIIDKGWGRMPDVADYVLAKPNSDKLGYGSECHIGSLIFAQCFIEPKWSIKQAVDELINKAIAGEKLQGERVCGA